MYVLAAVVAALGFAVASVLKHRSAQAIDSEAPTGRGRLGNLARRSIAHRLWLLAILVDIVATALHVVSLHLGPLTVVQPLMTVALLFALAIDARDRLSPRVWVWALVLIASIVGISQLTRPAAPATAADLLPAVLGGAVALGLATACVLLAARPGRSMTRAVLLGLGVGVLYAVNAALLKVLAAHVAAQGWVSLASSWQLYVVVVSGAAGLLLNQAAFQAGALAQALPAMSVADPLASIVIGIVVFDEPLVGGAAGPTLFVTSLAVLALATVRLALASVDPPLDAAADSKSLSSVA